MHKKYFQIILALILALNLVLAACGSPVADKEITPTTRLEPTPVIESTPTSLPTLTPSLERVVLLAPPDANPAYVSSLENLIAELAGEDGLTWETRTDFSSSDLDPSLRLLIALPPNPNLESLVSTSTEVQFLGVGIPGLVPAANVSLIGPMGLRFDQQGFMAGFIAAVITPDWRVGVIGLNDTQPGRDSLVGFINGVSYFCGKCRPVYPPYLHYPKNISLTQAEIDVSWRLAVDALVQASVQTVYVPPEASSVPMLVDLIQHGMKIIGGEEPSQEFQSSWVATIRPDPAQAVRLLWEDLLAGLGGASLPMPLVIEDVNPDLLSPGRLKFAESVMQELLDGYIDTAVDPIIGEAK